MFLSKRETLQILPIFFSLGINFKNLTVESYILYVLNTHVKIYSKISVIYYYINKIIFLYIILDYKNMKFKHLINVIVIDLWTSWKFACMADELIIYNLIVRFSKFTSNKKI